MSDVPRQRKSTPAELAASDARDPDFEPDEEFDEAIDLDLDAALPVEAEAKRSDVRVRVQGRDLVIPLLSEWPLRAVHLADNNDLLGAFECVMDPEDVEFLADLPGRQAGAIMEHLVKVSGVAPGESRRSAPSSRSTRKKSKRT